MSRARLAEMCLIALPRTGTPDGTDSVAVFPSKIVTLAAQCSDGKLRERICSATRTGTMAQAMRSACNSAASTH